MLRDQDAVIDDDGLILSKRFNIEDPGRFSLTDNFQDLEDLDFFGA